MDRRNFLKLPMAGAVLLPAAAVAKELAVPERDLQMVQAWAAPEGHAATTKIELLHTFNERIVSLVAFQDRIYCATERAVYELDPNAYLSNTFRLVR